MENLIGVVLGWVGTVGTFSAYVLIWRGWAKPTAKRYSLLNAAGGFMAGAGALSYGAWPAAVSNFVWGLLGVFGLIAAFRAGGASRSSGVIAAATPIMLMSPHEWDPSRTEASSIALPWLMRTGEDAVRISREDPIVSSGLDFASTEDFSHLGNFIPTTPTTPIPC